MKRDLLQFAGWVSLLYAAIAGLCCGCYSPSNKPGPAPEPAPVFDSPIARAADQGMTDYRTAAADVCRSIRERASTFEKWADFEKAWEQENYQARVKAFGPYTEAINQQLFARNPDGSWKTDGAIDVPKLQKVLQDAEEGFRGK